MILQDSYNRQIKYLRVSITDRCNLRCIYCLPQEGIKLLPPFEIMRYEELLKFIKILAKLGVNKVRITGGEPLLRSGIIEFVSELKKISDINDLSLTTNGILLPDMISGLHKAGLRRINISLNTLKKERYSLITGQSAPGRFNNVIDGINKALSLDMKPVKVNVVAMKGINDDEFADFVEFSKEKNIEVRFIEYMPIKERKINWNNTFISIADIKLIIEQKHGKLVPLSNLNNGPAMYFKVKGAKGSLGFISPVSNKFCNSCNRLRITSDGKLRLCLFSDAEADIKKVLRNGAGEEDIIRFVKEAILTKPKQHNLDLQHNHFVECQRTMAEIGG